MDLTIFNSYKIKYDFIFKPFKFSPYSQWFLWLRPVEDRENWDVNIYASTWLEVGNLTVKKTEHAKTCEYSLYDYIDDPENNDLYPEDFDYSPYCAFDDDYEVKYRDTYWTFDLGKDILSEDFYNKWYGEQGIYNYWVRGKQTW